MDLTAFTMCQENAMPILVFDLFEAGNLQRALKGEKVGSWVAARAVAPRRVTVVFGRLLESGRRLRIA